MFVLLLHKQFANQLCFCGVFLGVVFQVSAMSLLRGGNDEC